jgi:acetoacetate decarboxylase
MSKTHDFSGTCLSVDPPPYALPPYQYRDNQMLTLKVEVAEDYLRALVPEPMIVNKDNILVIYIGWLHVIQPKVVSYGEAGIMIPVSIGGRLGTYLPVLYLDEVELLTSGRELWGFPKFRGDVSFNRDDSSVSASVSDGGINIIEMAMDFRRAGEPSPAYDREHFLLKSIPAVSGDGFDVRQINTCRVRNDHRKEIWEGEADLQLHSTNANPLGDIPIRNSVSSVYCVGDILLDHGEVVHDYLALDNR